VFCLSPFGLSPFGLSQVDLFCLIPFGLSQRPLIGGIVKKVQWVGWVGRGVKKCLQGLR
jgi:hypothetical protein